MMKTTPSIFRGDTFTRRIGYRDDAGLLLSLTNDWTCKLKVQGTSIDKTITTKADDEGVTDGRFLAALTPTETRDLEVGQYIVAYELLNSTLTPSLEKEEQLILTVNEEVNDPSAAGPTIESNVERLMREVTEVEAQRINVALGKAVIDIWRDGRRIRKAIPTIAELDHLLRQLRGDLYQAQVEAGVSAIPRRTAIGVDYC